MAVMPYLVLTASSQIESWIHGTGVYSGVLVRHGEVGRHSLTVSRSVDQVHKPGDLRLHAHITTSFATTPKAQQHISTALSNQPKPRCPTKRK